MSNIGAISDANIQVAIDMDDLNDALSHLQNIAGITDGGVAAMVFSDIDFDWTTATREEREDKILHWIKTEADYEGEG